MGNVVGEKGAVTPTLLLSVQGVSWGKRFLIYVCVFFMGMIFPFRHEPFVHTLVSQGNDEILKHRLVLARKTQSSQSVFLSKRRLSSDLISACIHLHDKDTSNDSFLRQAV